MNSFDYFFIRRTEDDAYPLIRVAKRKKDSNGNTIFMNLELNDPAPRNPVLADYLSGSEVFLRKRIVDAIRSAFEFDGVAFIETELADGKGNTTDEYVAVASRGNSVLAMDKEKSVYTYDDTYWISKLVLDHNALLQLPESKRFILRLKEAPGYTLFHKSVAEAIMELKPTGMYFQNVETYEGGF